MNVRIVIGVSTVMLAFFAYGFFQSTISHSDGPIAFVSDDSDQHNDLETVNSAVCGNGIQEGSEACDDGNDIHNDGCSFCMREAVCGDGYIDPPEECDIGDAVANDQCNNQCLKTFCGDGVTQALNGYGQNEECDDGENIDDDGCTALCIKEFCGDGIIQFQEECDDNNDVDADECNNKCQRTWCGDGVTQRPSADGPEDCDDADTIDGNGCSNGCVKSCAWCTYTDAPACLGRQRHECPPSDCRDGRDNDNDGLVDSRDPECVLRTSFESEKYPASGDCTWDWQTNSCKSLFEILCKLWVDKEKAAGNADDSWVMPDSQDIEEYEPRLRQCSIRKNAIQEHSNQYQCDEFIDDEVRACFECDSGRCITVMGQHYGCQTFRDEDAMWAYVAVVQETLPPDVTLVLSGEQTNASISTAPFGTTCYATRELKFTATTAAITEPLCSDGPSTCTVSGHVTQCRNSYGNVVSKTCCGWYTSRRPPGSLVELEYWRVEPRECPYLQSLARTSTSITCNLAEASAQEDALTAVHAQQGLGNCPSIRSTDCYESDRDSGIFSCAVTVQCDYVCDPSPE